MVEPGRALGDEIALVRLEPRRQRRGRLLVERPALQRAADAVERGVAGVAHGPAFLRIAAFHRL